MEILKDWLFKRQKAYEKKARDFGLQEPKGLLLLGVPGCGKSLTAKSIASFWNMPLLRLDIGKVYQGLVGSSEDNIRKAIATAEAVAPCVLWIDEIEKGLNGVQSSGSTDGGVTSRIFSTILTWMQEKTSPVFMLFAVATTNTGVSFQRSPWRWWFWSCKLWCRGKDSPRQRMRGMHQALTCSSITGSSSSKT